MVAPQVGGTTETVESERPAPVLVTVRSGSGACKTSQDCPDGLTCCNSACINVNRDANGCGQLTCTGRSDACPPGLSCCQGLCTDTGRDSANCGACGVNCAGPNFCSGTACVPLTFASLCADSDITVLLGANGADAGATVAMALAALCPGAQQITAVPQGTDAGAIDVVSGAPIAGVGHLLVAVGGPSTERVADYLQEHLSPVYSTVTDAGDLAWVARDGRVLAEEPATDLTIGHDLFVLQLVSDPVSGTATLIAEGGGGSGTAAAAWYLANGDVIRGSLRDVGWALFDWTEAAGEGGPSARDTFTELASGE